MNMHNQGQYISTAQGFMSKVYAWLATGLGISAAVAYYVSLNKAIMVAVAQSFALQMVLFLGMLGIIFYVSSQVQRLSYVTMAALFIIFASMKGVLLAPILLIYKTASIVNVLAVTMLMFFGMAAYGWLTKSDLSSMGNILLMGLWGLIISGVVNFFLQSSAFNIVISACGVGIFAMLVAYDVQNLKRLSQQVMMTTEDAGKYAVLGALGLYLNVINLFLYLLRLFGDRRD